MHVSNRFRRCVMIAKTALSLLALGVLLAAALLVEAAPPAQSAEEGQALFQQHCIACHTIGGGTLVGPDLQGVTARRDPAWLASWIQAPDKMLAANDPIAIDLLQQYNQVPMPNLGLTEAEVASLIAYLETQAGPAAEAAQPATTNTAQAGAALPPGDPIAGKALFTGVNRFQNGGPACMACHSVAGIGALGGGALGPDLTPAFNKFGPDGLSTFLTSLPTPTMNAIWSRQPLTPQEQAHVAAFLQQAVAQRSPQTAGQLALLATVVAALLLGLAQLRWRRRLLGVRRPMIARRSAHTRS